MPPKYFGLSPLSKLSSTQPQTFVFPVCSLSFVSSPPPLNFPASRSTPFQSIPSRLDRRCPTSVGRREDPICLPPLPRVCRLFCCFVLFPRPARRLQERIGPPRGNGRSNPRCVRPPYSHLGEGWISHGKMISNSPLRSRVIRPRPSPRQQRAVGGSRREKRVKRSKHEQFGAKGEEARQANIALRRG